MKRLLSSAVEPLRNTSATSSAPLPSMVFSNPDAMDSTPANTPVSAAIPDMATAAVPGRRGRLRRFSTASATVCVSHPNIGPIS